MRVIRLCFDGFRNLKTGEIRPDEGVNIFHGENAQGKTNLLEALWLFTGARSFRGARDRDLVAFGRDRAALSLDFFAGDRDQNATLTIETRRRATINGVDGKPATALAGVFCGIVFSPVHLSLIKDGPEGRRRFMDAAYCQLRPGYLTTLSEYHRVLAQRNAVLKAGGSEEMLSLWDDKLCRLGSRICLARQAYLTRLLPVCQEIYDGLSGGRETLTLRYEAAVLPGDRDRISDRLLCQLREHRREDRAAGFTTVGVHREDLVAEINGLSARIYGSQGQQRSVVLALKLAEAALLRDVTGERPVALLDDVMSELDTFRQDYILNRLEGWQVFITCCDPGAVLRLTGGSTFAVRQGRVTAS